MAIKDNDDNFIEEDEDESILRHIGAHCQDYLLKRLANRAMEDAQTIKLLNTEVFSRVRGCLGAINPLSMLTMVNPSAVGGTSTQSPLT